MTAAKTASNPLMPPRSSGALFLDGDGALISAMALDVAEGQIQAVRSVVNPDKLRHLGPVADIWSGPLGGER